MISFQSQPLCHSPYIIIIISFSFSFSLAHSKVKSNYSGENFDFSPSSNNNKPLIKKWFIHSFNGLNTAPATHNDNEAMMMRGCYARSEVKDNSRDDRGNEAIRVYNWRERHQKPQREMSLFDCVVTCLVSQKDCLSFHPFQRLYYSTQQHFLSLSELRLHSSSLSL